MFSGPGLEVNRRGIGPGQEVVDLVIGIAVDDPGDDFDEVGLRIDGIEFAGLDQRGDDRPVLAAAVGTREECILAIEGNRTDCPLRDVGIDLDAAIIEEERQAFPARQRIADRLGELGLLADQSELGVEPGLEVLDDRPAFLVTNGAPFLSATATNVALDGVEPGDALQPCACHPRSRVHTLWRANLTDL